MEEFIRERMLIGEENVTKLSGKKVIIFGLGGVGSYACEAIARAGILNIDIVDNDIISISNINRQLIALHSTVGLKKTEVVKSRILDINPLCKVNTFPYFYDKTTYDLIKLDNYDFVIDCIDTITSKIYLSKYCFFNNINLISSMGTGNRLDPTKFEITDVFKTEYDPVARVMRRELKKAGVKRLVVLASKEIPIKQEALFDETTKRSIPGSISYVPSVAGLIIASHVINKMLKDID